RLERDDLDVAEAEAFLLQYVAELIVERRTELGHADAPPLEVADGPDAGIPEVLLDDNGRERITGPLPPLVGDDPDPLTAQDDVVEGGRQPGRADVDLAGGQRGGDGRRRPEKGQLDVHALLLEEALLHSAEDRSLRIPTRPRSRRPRPQCDSTPRSESTTMPTMSFVVAMMLPA